VSETAVKPADEPEGYVIVPVRMSRAMYGDIVGLSAEMELTPGLVVLVALRLLVWLRLELRWGSRLLMGRRGVITEWAIPELRTVTRVRPARWGGWRWLRELAVISAEDESERS
jgi:hypothetical protein